MKKSLALFSMTALMLVFACKKEEKNDPFQASYTTETVQQSKTNVEQNAVDLVDQLDALSTAKGIQVIMNLAGLNPTGTTKSTFQNPVLKPISLISSLGDKSQVRNIFKSMKDAGSLMEEDPIAVSALFDSLTGKYTYNFETEEFDRADLEGKIVFEFPGLENDLTNTAVITVDKFSVAEISNPGDNWPSGLANELPTGLRIGLTYNNVSVAGVSLSAAYKSDGMPTKVNVEMFVDDFTLSMTATHSPYTSASYINTLKFKGDILLETYIAAEGDWSAENIDNNVIETDTSSEMHIENIIKNANAHLIVMNLEVLGKVNMKTLGDALWAIDDNRDALSQEQAAQAAVDALNANAELIVIYRDSNKKIAEAEAYVASETDEYSGDTEYYPAMRFVYADGSYVDMNTYMDSGSPEINDFYNSLNQFIDDLNAEYGLEIDPVDPGTRD
jgi:hypothetical protein